MLFGCGYRLFAIFRRDHFKPGARQQIAKNATIVLLIFDDEDALAHACPTRVSTAMGSVKEKVEPLPSFESTRSRPPCISMFLLEMVSPSQEPPFLRVVDESACWNSSKIRA